MKKTAKEIGLFDAFIADVIIPEWTESRKERRLNSDSKSSALSDLRDSLNRTNANIVYIEERIEAIEERLSEKD